MEATIKLDIGTIKVQKLPLKKYSELLKMLQTIPTKLVGLKSAETTEIIRNLPLIVAESLPEVINILCFASSLTPEQAEDERFGLDDAVQIVIAILEVNNYTGIYERLKKGVRATT